MSRQSGLSLRKILLISAAGMLVLSAAPLSSMAADGSMFPRFKNPFSSRQKEQDLSQAPRRVPVLNQGAMGHQQSVPVQDVSQGDPESEPMANPAPVVDATMEEGREGVASVSQEEGEYPALSDIPASPDVTTKVESADARMQELKQAKEEAQQQVEEMDAALPQASPQDTQAMTAGEAPVVPETMQENVGEYGLTAEEVQSGTSYNYADQEGKAIPTEATYQPEAAMPAPVQQLPEETAVTQSAPMPTQTDVYSEEMASVPSQPMMDVTVAQPQPQEVVEEITAEDMMPQVQPQPQPTMPQPVPAQQATAPQGWVAIGQPQQQEIAPPQQVQVPIAPLTASVAPAPIIPGDAPPLEILQESAVQPAATPAQAVLPESRYTGRRQYFYLKQYQRQRQSNMESAQ